MDSKTNNIRPDRAERVKLDKIDRKLLRLLAKDSDKTYSELSELVFLSPPAVHERVQKLRRNGVIKGTHAVLDGPSLGCSLLSFLHVEAEGSVRMDMLNLIEKVQLVDGVKKVKCFVVLSSKLERGPQPEMDDLS